MSWVLGILAAIFLLDALRMRGRLAGLRPLGADEGDGPLVVAAAPGADVDDATRRAAAGHMQREGLRSLDLVPRDLPAQRALALAALVDIPGYRRDRLATGRTAGVALAVAPELAARASLDPTGLQNPVAFVRAAHKLKAYACTETDFAVAPHLRAPAEDADKRYAMTRELIGGATPFVLGAQLLTFAVLALGVALPSARPWGITALAAFHLQPVIAALGTALRPRDLWLVTLLRLPLELASWVRTVTGRWRPEDPDLVSERRPVYADLLAGDAARFFEPRRETCPVCDSGALAVHLRTTDLLQHKPGTFTLERCGDCGHIFQNPRLSLEGLDFYYKDFYDGLGAKGMEFVFGYQSTSYVARAEMVKRALASAAPERWLDVGAGHGHFCCVARDVLPATHFDGLDLSESIEEAERRGWIEKGYRGLFPDASAELAGAYDVVSMHHYLEHTLDPRAEIAAARETLADGGHLLIEVPDPQSMLGRVLRRYWIPWFQPQHQHLLSRANLERILRDTGFTPLQWHRGEAHQRVDFLFAVFLLLDRIAPPTDRPWRPPARLHQRLWRNAVWTAGAPLLLLARGVDKVLDPAVRRWGASNTYRVLAQKRG